MEHTGGRGRKKGEGNWQIRESGNMEESKERGGRGRESRGKEGNEKGDKKERGREGIWKVAFWNLAGVINKDKEFWEGVESWDVVVLMETWLDEKGWERIRGRLPKGYKWKVQIARKRNRKGRACGGMLLGIRKELIEEEEEAGEEEGRMVCKIKIGEEKWRIVGMYVNGEIERRLESIRDWIEVKDDEVKTIIGGDFNARTGEEGGWIIEEDQEEETKSRTSKDKKVNKEGKILIEFMEKKGYAIFNGNIKGDDKEEYTYTGGRGESVIDYIIGDGRVRDRIERMEVEERIESDHHPIVAWIRGKIKGERRREGKRQTISRGTWDEEGKKEFIEKIGRLEDTGEGVGEEIRRTTEKIRRTIEECNDEKRKEKRNKKGWWDEECRERKRQVRGELRKWKRDGGKGDRYRLLKKEYKGLCEEKKKEEKERMIKEVGEAKTEGNVWDVWELVNRERKKRKRLNETIELEVWKEYFMGLLGGVEKRAVKGMGREEGRREKKEKEVEREEVKGAIGRLKDGKALGIDGIPNEVWRYGGEELKNWAWEICRRVWRGEGWPDQWKEGGIVPIIKKGDGERVENYRGVTLMPSIYKIYTTILAERLKEEVEGKGIIPSNQTGFRKGMGTIDQIYTLNYIVNRQLGKEKGGLVALFIDLKAAFDSLDREVLIRAMRERGVREGLVERVEEILRETKSRVRIGKQWGDEFWTVKGVRDARLALFYLI